MSWFALLAILLVMALTPFAVMSPVGLRWRWWAVIGLVVALLIIVAFIDDGARRTLQFSLLPAGLVWLISGALAIVCFRKRHGLYGYLLLAVFILIGVGANYRFGATLMSQLESRIDAQALGLDETYDVVCILGGGANRRLDGGPQLSATGDRVRVTAWLYRQQRMSLILATGTFAPDTQALLGQFGIPGEQVLVEPQPENTAQEIALIKRLAAERGWKRIGVVSSAWHLPRVARLAAHQDLSLLPLPSDWLGVVPPWSGELVIPRGEGLRLVELALKEHLGLLF